jgi:hypothetical protein
MSTVRDILRAEEVHTTEKSSGACGMAVGETTVELVTSCSRMMDRLDVRGTLRRADCGSWLAGLGAAADNAPFPRQASGVSVHAPSRELLLLTPYM